MTDAYDVVVVGAGPAGAVTALQLARGGWRTLLLDRRAHPREKPCGDCLSPEATRVFDRLGLLEAVDALAPARLDGWRIWAPDGRSFTGSFERAAGGDARVRSALAISRDRLDRALLDAALGAGAELRAPVRVEDLLVEEDVIVGVRVRDESGGPASVRARLVVGADGLRSVVARRARATGAGGALRKYSLTLHPRLPRDFVGDIGEMHVVRAGCIGIAPVESCDRPLHNVTFVTVSGARAGSPRDVLAAMLSEARGLAGRCDELTAAVDNARPLASGPFDRPARFVVADGLALVGDAAGYYDPFTGQGVYQALAGAERLADVAQRALQRSGPVRAADLGAYARWLRRSRRPARAVQRTIEYVTARPRLMNGATRAIAAAPRFADTLVGVTGDVMPARSLAGAPLLSLGAGIVRTATRSST